MVRVERLAERIVGLAEGSVNGRSRTSDARSQPLVQMWRGCQRNPGTGSLADPFAVDPIRRSVVLVAVCGGIIFVPWLFGQRVAEMTMLTVGWLAGAGFVLGIPVLVWSVGEELNRMLRRRRHPGVEQLDLSPRVRHILVRHGYETIASIEDATDEELGWLSNMDGRGLRETRRSVTLWRYQRWQDRGFPATGD